MSHSHFSCVQGKKGSTGSWLYCPPAAVCNTAELVSRTGLLLGVRSCNIGFPSIQWPHTQQPTHKPLIVSPNQGGTNKQMVTILLRNQTYTHRLAHKMLPRVTAPTHQPTYWETIPRARYRVHYFGMPHCFPPDLRCTVLRFCWAWLAWLIQNKLTLELPKWLR